MLQEQILAERKSLSIQIAQQNIQADIQDKMQLIQQRARNESMSDENSLNNLRGDSQIARSFASFESQSPIFRGMGSDEDEQKRQSALRKKYLTKK